MVPPMPVLHIIEPTMNNTAGHCHAIAHSLAKAASDALPGLRLHVWAGSQYSPSSMQDTTACVHPHFHRRWRKPQLWTLLRKLLQNGEPAILTTAGRPEMAILAMLPKRLRANAPVWLYVHQMRMNPARTRRLQQLARRIPNARILCTHPSLVEHIRNAGFQDVRHHPCPFPLPAHTFKSQPFRQVIFPGVARMDKNLPMMARVVKKLAENHPDIPIMIQAAPDHHGRFPDAVKRLLDKMRRSHPSIVMPMRAFDAREYADQFSGAICLQPYAAKDYANKISGITLDALTHGCPIIALRGAWPAEVVDEFSAGIVMDSLNEDAWVDAILRIASDYPRYQKQCRTAMDILIQRHHPLRMLEALASWGAK